MSLKYFNRKKNQVEEELVFGGELVNWLYQSNSGKLLSHLLCRAPISKAYGIFQNSIFSKEQIPQFVKNYNINLDDFEAEENRPDRSPYSSFNSFFIRKFKPNRRAYPIDKKMMGAFAEARYYGFESISNNERIPVKGKYLSPKGLINNLKWNATFENGPLLLARLCPVDYHRFHFPDDGKVLDTFRIPGLYHSVNPVAIKAKEDVYITNERQVTIIETESFGKLAYIEVGAICVGKIVQSNRYLPGVKFKRGEEKGYFLFGGSTVIVVGEQGAWKPSLDIIENTKNKIETYIELGDTVASVL